ncbi:MAG: hypothetical protein QXX17_01760 [Conexivisphaerales archaeon]
MSHSQEGSEDKKIIVYTESDGSRYEVEYPATSKIEVRNIADALELPAYLDTNSPMVSTAVVALWVSYSADGILALHKEMGRFKEPPSPLLMGGLAVKMLSRTANEKGPMNRNVKDIDYVVRRSQGGNFVKLLSILSNIAGTRFFHFLTSSDMRFNALRAGERYRIRTIDWSSSDRPEVRWVDILIDRIEMRHKVDVRDEFDRAKKNLYTIGVEKLLLTKCQMIQDIEQTEYVAIQESGQEFRILRYPFYKTGRYLIGMEEKDMMDAAALLCDHAGNSEVIASHLSDLLRKDDKLLQTFRLNLENIESRKDWLRGKGISEVQLSRIDESIGNILKKLPEKRRWDKPWWNRDVDTPVIN